MYPVEILRFYRQNNQVHLPHVRANGIDHYARFFGFQRFGAFGTFFDQEQVIFRYEIILQKRFGKRHAHITTPYNSDFHMFATCYGRALTKKVRLNEPDPAKLLTGG